MRASHTQAPQKLLDPRRKPSPVQPSDPLDHTPEAVHDTEQSHNADDNPLPAPAAASVLPRPLARALAMRLSEVRVRMGKSLHVASMRADTFLTHASSS
jgi:hypothetical protein